MTSPVPEDEHYKMEQPVQPWYIAKITALEEKVRELERELKLYKPVVSIDIGGTSGY